MPITPAQTQRLLAQAQSVLSALGHKPHQAPQQQFADFNNAPEPSPERADAIAAWQCGGSDPDKPYGHPVDFPGVPSPFSVPETPVQMSDARAAQVAGEMLQFIGNHDADADAIADEVLRSLGK